MGKSVYEKMKKKLEEKFEDVTLIPILAKDVHTEGDQTIKSFGIKELKNKTIEKIKNTKGIIYNYIKEGTLKNIKKPIIEEIHSFGEKTKDLVFYFKNVKNENDFKDYIVKLLRLLFGKGNSKKNKTITDNNYLLNKDDCIINIIKSCIKIYKEYTEEKVNSILEDKSIIFLDAQAMIEKVKRQSILHELKKDKDKFQDMIKKFLTNNFYYVAQKFIIYYTLVYKIIPFISEIEKLSDNIIVDLLKNVKEDLIESIYEKKLEDFKEKVNGNDFNKKISYAYIKNENYNYDD